jgi:hypothetical protein
MKRTLAFAACLLLTGALRADSPNLSDRAAAAFIAKDWATAETLYAQLLDDPAQKGLAPFRRGVAQLYLGRVKEARASLDQAEQQGYMAPAVAYRRACADAVEGKRDAAIAQLERAVQGGFSQLALLDSEPLLASLRAEPAFAKVKETLQRQVAPCQHDTRYRAFDFWIGEWDVRPNGAPESTPPSENIITLEYGDCVLIEHWKSIGGGSGTSVNIFDASREAWFQTWVDASGGLHEYRGNPDADGNMIFHGETPGGPGQPARMPTKMTFIRLGADTLRQFSEISLDGGKTWSSAYDFVYMRRVKK